MQLEMGQDISTVDIAKEGNVIHYSGEERKADTKDNDARGDNVMDEEVEKRKGNTTDDDRRGDNVIDDADEISKAITEYKDEKDCEKYHATKKRLYTQ